MVACAGLAASFSPARAADVASAAAAALGRALEAVARHTIVVDAALYAVCAAVTLWLASRVDDRVQRNVLHVMLLNMAAVVLTLELLIGIFDITAQSATAIHRTDNPTRIIVPLMRAGIGLYVDAHLLYLYFLEVDNDARARGVKPVTISRMRPFDRNVAFALGCAALLLAVTQMSPDTAVRMLTPLVATDFLIYLVACATCTWLCASVADREQLNAALWCLFVSICALFIHFVVALVDTVPDKNRKVVLANEASSWLRAIVGIVYVGTVGVVLWRDRAHAGPYGVTIR